MTTYNSRAKSISLFDTSIFLELLRLMKPRVMSLVIFTCAVGLLTAPGEISFIKSITNIFFVTLGAGAAGALNMWYEADLDKLMSRTCLRPLPTGKLKKKHALIFGIVLSVVSVLGLYYFSNLLSALVLLFTISFYLFVYSLLMVPTLALPYLIGFVGELFLVSTFGLTIYYILLCYALLKTKKDSFDLQKAKRVFGYSIFYLFFIFVLFLIDKLF